MRAILAIGILSAVSAYAQSVTLDLSTGVHTVRSTDAGGTYVPFVVSATVKLNERWAVQPGFELWQCVGAEAFRSSRYTLGSLQLTRMRSLNARSRLFVAGGVWLGGGRVRYYQNYPDATRRLFGPGGTAGLEYSLSEQLQFRAGLRLVVLTPGIDIAAGPVVSLSFRVK